MKEFIILSHLKRIILFLAISGLFFHYSYAKSAIQTQVGGNIKYVVAKNVTPNNSTTSQVIFIKSNSH
jgi:hypothetical protein